MASFKAQLDKMQADPHRPRYHFTMPGVIGVPGDPNGAFYALGRYHLMYLYRNTDTDAYHWGHISSADLLHWEQHPDAIGQHEGDEGCFSGGAFVDDDNTAYLTFWKFPSKKPDGDKGGIAIAYAKPPYDHWERIWPLAIEGNREQWGIVDREIDGRVEHLGCADPSNIWKKDGVYYMQTGNLCVLNEYGRTDDATEQYRGDWTDLWKSEDMANWSYVGRFYQKEQTGEDWPDRSEDDMCPSFLPLPDKKCGGQLTDKWLQLFIAHNKGTQYYIGKLNGERLHLEQHGRMSWMDNTYFAPEALIDDKNRHIAWCWLLDNRENEYERFGWTGVYCFPRLLWLENGHLAMAPACELDSLQQNEQVFPVGKVDGKQELAVTNGSSFRLRAKVKPGDADEASFLVRCDPARCEQTKITVSRSRGLLIYEGHFGGKCSYEQAPFTLADGETVSFDIFVDRSVVEVYVNERQAICRRMYPTSHEKAIGVYAVSDGADFGDVVVYEMAAANLF